MFMKTASSNMIMQDDQKPAYNENMYEHYNPHEGRVYCKAAVLRCIHFKLGVPNKLLTKCI